MEWFLHVLLMVHDVIMAVKDFNIQTVYYVAVVF
jgi:hypothetical protein